MRFEQLMSGMRNQLQPSVEKSIHYKYLQQMIGWESLQPETFKQYQLKQLAQLLNYAIENSEWYADILSACGYDPKLPLTEEIWQTIPILERADVASRFAQIKTRVSPAEHGKVFHIQTSGSTGKPLDVLNTEFTQFMFQLNVLREQVWHQRDPGKRFAAIRPDKISTEDRVKEFTTWGKPTHLVFQSASSGIMHSSVPVDEQLQWLLEFKPSCLLTLPGNLKALLQLSRKTNQFVPDLLEVRSYGETVSDELRESVKDIWNVPLVDMYSTTEAGYFAIQCPGKDHYHIVSDTTYVEILDENAVPCRPGEIGRVVVTPLHNFAFPLIRYEIEDYAEVGQPCGCGCLYPVIKKVVGRTRNMLHTPDGKTWWPSFPSEDWHHIAPIKQLQIVQDRLDHLNVNLVLEQPLSSIQEAQFREVLLKCLNYPFEIDFIYMEEIVRNKNGKFEEFVSEIEP